MPHPIDDAGFWTHIHHTEVRAFCDSCLCQVVYFQNGQTREECGIVDRAWLNPQDGWIWARVSVRNPHAIRAWHSFEINLSVTAEMHPRTKRRVSPFKVVDVELYRRGPSEYEPPRPVRIATYSRL